MADWLKAPKQGEPITAKWAEAIVLAITQLQSDPKVVSPLANKDGAIWLAQDYESHPAKTTASIPGRVAGGPWKSGPANFLTIKTDGTEVIAAGIAATKVWNYTGGTIPTGTRVLVAWIAERWTILSADCSGIA